MIQLVFTRIGKMIMDYYEKFFGTKERALVTLYSLNISVTELFEESEERLKDDFMNGNTIYKHNYDHLKSWNDWLDKEV